MVSLEPIPLEWEVQKGTMVYGNEEEVGQAVQEAMEEQGLQREDIFVITKIYPGSETAVAASTAASGSGRSRPLIQSSMALRVVPPANLRPAEKPASAL